ncbi:MAG: type II toxin-antitoxin system HicB family antitoxin [Thermodesulfobacteriota bacterium]
MKLKVIIHEAEEGGFWAEVPALPGCVTEGDTWDELMNNVREAAEGWLLAAEDLKTTGHDRVAEIVV